MLFFDDCNWGDHCGAVARACVEDASGEGVVAVGKYLSDDVYVSARQSAGGTSTEVSVTYEVTDHITVESTLEPTGTQDVSVNYKKDY